MADEEAGVTVERLIRAIYKIVAKGESSRHDAILEQMEDPCSDPDTEYWKELWEDYDGDEFESRKQLAEDDEAMENCHDDLGDTGLFFRDPKPLPKGTWLVHFTKTNPLNILREGFKGAGIEHLGLTKGGGNRTTGEYALAYRLQKVTDFSPEYGNNVVLFQADVAVEAYHSGDDEDQVIFDVRTVNKMKGFERVGDSYKVYNLEGKLVGTVPAVKKSFK